MKRKRLIVFWIILVIGLLVFIECVNAATITTESCSETDVQNAINSADDGDTVNVPAGSCTWTSGATIPDGVKLIGAGAFDADGGKNTVISSSGFIVTHLGTGSWLEGFKFVNGIAKPDNNAGEQDWVIKDNYFGNTGGKQYIGVSRGDGNGDADYEKGTTAGEPPSGVYHGNYLYNIKMTNNGKITGETAWYEPTNPGGTDHAVYFENNTFDLSGNVYPDNNVFDSSFGGRTVFRFNKFINARMEQHGAWEADSSGGNPHRGPRLLEAYDNYWDMDYSLSYNAWLIRSLGGINLIFNNFCKDTAFGGAYCDIELLQYRSSGSNGGYCSPDGSNPFDTPGDADTLAGTPAAGKVGCRDMHGMGKDSALSPTLVKGDDSTDDQADQYYEPSYIWNTTYYDGNVMVQTSVSNLDTDYITENINYFQGDGTADAGVRSGKFASAPECNPSTAYYGYWATDQGDWNSENPGPDGQLYVCDGANWNLYYTPAPYPHPLISGGSGLTCTSGADSDGDSSVSTEELVDYISYWKNGSVAIGDLISAIAEWKNGC